MNHDNTSRYQQRFHVGAGNPVHYGHTQSQPPQDYVGMPPQEASANHEFRSFQTTQEANAYNHGYSQNSFPRRAKTPQDSAAGFSQMDRAAMSYMDQPPLNQPNSASTIYNQEQKYETTSKLWAWERLVIVLCYFTEQEGSQMGSFPKGTADNVFSKDTHSGGPTYTPHNFGSSGTDGFVNANPSEIYLLQR